MQRVLLGAAGTGLGFAIARCLKQNWGPNVYLVGVDTNPRELVSASLVCDDFIRVPQASTDAYAEKITSIITADGIDTYIPIINAELLQAQRISGSSPRPVDIWHHPHQAQLTDKRTADRWLRSIGVDTPRQPTDQEIGAAGTTWFVKPVDGSGSLGVFVAKSPEDLRRVDREKHLVQEVCERPEVTVDSFYDPGSGHLVAVCRERLETKAGVCTKARVFMDEAMSAIARKVAEGLGQVGALCFQVMSAPSGPVVTDLNLRMGAGTSMSAAAGYDFVAATYALRTGQDHRPWLAGDGVRLPVIVTRQYSEYLMLD